MRETFGRMTTPAARPGVSGRVIACIVNGMPASVRLKRIFSKRDASHDAGACSAAGSVYGLPSSTATTTSAPRCNAALTGAASQNPPSSRYRPWCATGRAMKGMAMLASIASISGPRSMITSQRSAMSDAVAANGTGICSIWKPASAS